MMNDAILRYCYFKFYYKTIQTVTEICGAICYFVRMGEEIQV